MKKLTLSTTRIDKPLHENLYHTEQLVSSVREQISKLPRQEGTDMIREMELISVPPKMKAREEVEIIMKGNLKPYINFLKAKVTTNPGTIVNYLYVVKELHKFIGDKHINDITKQDMDDFVASLKERYKTNSMVSRSAGLRNYMKFLGKDKEIDIKIPQPIETKTEEDCLTVDEVQRIFKATQDNKRDNAILKTLYYTGVRKSELINLNLEDIDFQGKQVTIRNGKGKNGSPETINIHDQALESIKEYLKVRETPKPEYEGALFISGYQRRMCPSSIDYLVEEVRAKAKIKKRVYPHIFRSSLITHMHQAGASAFHIKQQSRHKTMIVLNRYIRPGKEERLKTYETYVQDIETPQKPQEQVTEQPKPQEPTPKKKPEEPEPDPMVNSVDDEIKLLEIEQKLIRLRQQAKETHKSKTEMFYQ